MRCCEPTDDLEDPCDYDAFCSSGICVACGRSGDMCCPGSTCFFTNSCNANNLCAITCGVEGLPCCPIEEDYANTPDGCQYDDYLCLSDVCTSCGGIGQPCCRGDRCDDAASECVEGSCVECGVTGAPCCSGSVFILSEYSGNCYEYNSECTDEGICVSGQSDAPLPAPAPVAAPAPVPSGSDPAGATGLPPLLRPAICLRIHQSLPYLVVLSTAITHTDWDALSGNSSRTKCRKLHEIAQHRHMHSQYFTQLLHVAIQRSSTRHQRHHLVCHCAQLFCFIYVLVWVLTNSMPTSHCTLG